MADKPCKICGKLNAMTSPSNMLRRDCRPTVLFWTVALAAVTLFSSPALADDPIPPPLNKYHGRRIATTMHYLGAPWLVRESRQREEDCETMLAALNVQPGQTVCDMGCGNGFYTLPLSKLVGERGKVVAVDIQREMLLLLKDRAAAENVGNIELVHGTVVDPQLKPNTVDLVLMVDVYHEFSHPEQMLQAIRASLKPGGRVALVEFRAEDRSVPIKKLHKMSKKQILKEFEPNGFQLVEEFEKLPWQHLMFFDRDESQDGDRATADANASTD